VEGEKKEKKNRKAKNWRRRKKKNYHYDQDLKRGSLGWGKKEKKEA